MPETSNHCEFTSKTQRGTRRPIRLRSHNTLAHRQLEDNTLYLNPQVTFNEGKKREAIKLGYRTAGVDVMRVK